MKVKIGDTIHNSAQEPILLILSPQERLDIIGMPPQVDRYLAMPEGMNPQDSWLLRQWIMETPDTPLPKDNLIGGEG